MREAKGRGLFGTPVSCGTERPCASFRHIWGLTVAVRGQKLGKIATERHVCTQKQDLE